MVKDGKSFIDEWESLVEPGVIFGIKTHALGRIGLVR